MNDLISREALLDAIDHERKLLIERDQYGAEHVVVHHARKIIEELPTVDAIPVEWLQRRRDIYLKAYHAGHESEIHTAAILNDTLRAYCFRYGCHVSANDTCEYLITEEDHEQGPQRCTVQPGASPRQRA